MNKIFNILIIALLINVSFFSEGFADNKLLLEKQNIASNSNIEMINNYIVFEKIDSIGVSQEVIRCMKVIWNAFDVYIDYINTTDIDSAENAVLQLKILIDTVADTWDIGRKMAKNLNDFSYMINIMENIEKKLSLNNLDSVKNIIFNN